MARRLSNYEFTNNAGAPRKYPWDTWIDGSVWQAKRGVDYECSDKHFQTAVHTRARTEDNMKAITQNPEPGVVVFQFYEIED